MLRHQLERPIDDLLNHVRPIKRLLRPLYHSWQDLFIGDLLRRNAALKDIYLGQRCFILCTGYSLKELDLSALAAEHTIACSAFYLHPEARRLNLVAYSDTEPVRNLTRLRLDAPKVFERTGDARQAIEFYSRIDGACASPETIIFMKADNRRFIQRHGLFHGRRVHYIDTDRPMQQAREQRNDLTRRITFIDGSIYCMLGIAMYLGFKELYLCGAGYTYSPCQSGHFYEDHPVLRDSASDPGVYPCHKMVRRFAERQGVQIYNVVPGGFESPVYEKVTWQFVVEAVLERTATPAACRGSSLK